MFKETDLAYTAGYIDGDGCFYIGTYTTSNETIYEYSIQVCSVKKESTDWLKKTFGGNIQIKEAHGNRKIPYTWTIKGKESLEFAKAIKPYLAEKQIECSLCGELAGNVNFTRDLLNIGIRNFSVQPTLLPIIKNKILTQLQPASILK